MATIRDVAREAGVSIATVSRVFNDSELVSDGTRRQVQDVASRLNYLPNGVARSLITSRTHTLGVLLPDLHGEFFSEVIRGIDRAARQQGFHLLVSSSHAATEELMAALRLMRGRIDGLIVMAPDVEASGAIRADAGEVPVVLLNPGDDVEVGEAISIANHEGAATVVRHLLALGHRRIATVVGPERNVDARQRLGGYRASLENAGIPLDPDLELTGDFTEFSGYAAARALLQLVPRPTAVFVGNDKMAVGVMGAVSDAGLKVPDDLAVVGFDDIEMARYLTPPLTTVHVDAFRLGECAVEKLLRLTRDGQGPVRHEVMPATLVVRGSCGASSADARVHRGDLIGARFPEREGR
ncbi:MAG TPA: LacI family DNA-binding transcriptional regulator [Candidatus Limnocylindria bacterium]|nr:LacI family DNA-binding transcriptional regulator [Candidatus Limnocylindria bacterium]